MHYYFSISALLTATVHNANQCTYLHFSAPLSIYVSGCLYTCRLCNFFCLCFRAKISDHYALPFSPHHFQRQNIISNDTFFRTKLSERKKKCSNDNFLKKSFERPLLESVRIIRVIENEIKIKCSKLNCSNKTFYGKLSETNILLMQVTVRLQSSNCNGQTI